MHDLSDSYSWTLKKYPLESENEVVKTGQWTGERGSGIHVPLVDGLRVEGWVVEAIVGPRVLS